MVVTRHLHGTSHPAQGTGGKWEDDALVSDIKQRKHGLGHSLGWVFGMKATLFSQG